VSSALFACDVSHSARPARNVIGLKYRKETFVSTRMYPKVSGLAAWRSENYKWYSSLPLGAVV
jgi:hypothetical protein